MKFLFFKCAVATSMKIWLKPVLFVYDRAIRVLSMFEVQIMLLTYYGPWLISFAKWSAKGPSMYYIIKIWGFLTFSDFQNYMRLKDIAD